MNRIIKLLPIAAVLCMGMQSCDRDDTDTLSYGQQPNGDYAVDLGLKVKWATCNVGAEKPEDYGDYFAWGDNATYYEPGYAQEHPQAHWKTDKWKGYSWSTYMHSNGSSETLFKYCSRSDFGYEGFTDTLTILTSDDDVAHYKWGGNWRMPTVAEFEELLFNCDCEWITQNGVKGLKVTSRKDSSQSIFLPATGFRDGTGLNGVDDYGYYWSSSFNKGFPVQGKFLCFSTGGHYTSVISRCCGLSVRPVCP